MPENFIAQFVWITDGNFDNQAKIKSCHEYVLLYAKDASKFDYPLNATVFDTINSSSIG